VPIWATLLRLAVAVALVVAVEISPLWSWLQTWLASLDFDPPRVDLLSAWLACFVLAGLAGALSARAWPAASTAVGLLTVGYAIPSALTAHLAPPLVFGVPEQVDIPALFGNLAAVLGLGGVLAVLGGAVGQLVGQALRDFLHRPGCLWGQARIVALALACLATALGAPPLIRYGPAAGVYLPQASPATRAGEVLFRTYESAAMGQERPYAVYLPPGYASHSQQRYPVLYLLHGDPGDYTDWLNLGLPRLLDAGIARGLLPPLIAVMPDGNGTHYRATQWANSLDGRDRVDDSLLEVVAVVDREYQSEPSRRYRVIAGLSEGGFGAVNLAARHPALFGTAISLSGFFAPAGPVFGNNAAYLRANSPTRILASPGPARSVDYLLVVGAQDPSYRELAQAFAAELDRLGVIHQLFILPGGHEGKVWTNGLATCLEVLKPQLEPQASRVPLSSPQAFHENAWVP
jgi:enterochelin esterase-like enzyme